MHVHAWMHVCAMFEGQRQLVGVNFLLLPWGSQESSPGRHER